MTQETAAILQGAGWSCECRGPTPIKGKGTLITYFVHPPYDAHSFSVHAIRPDEGALLRQSPPASSTERIPYEIKTPTYHCVEVPSEPTLPPRSEGEKPCSIHETAGKAVGSVKDAKDTPSFSFSQKKREKCRREVGSTNTGKVMKLDGGENKTKSESLPHLTCQSSSYSLSSSIPTSFSTPHLSFYSDSSPPPSAVLGEEHQARGKESEGRKWAKSAGLCFLKKAENRTLENVVWKMEEGEKYLSASQLHGKCGERTSNDVDSKTNTEVNSLSQFPQTAVGQTPSETTLRENGFTSNYQGQLTEKLATYHIMPSSIESHGEKKSQGGETNVSQALYISSSIVDKPSSSSAVQHGDTRTDKSYVAKGVLVNYQKETDGTTSCSVNNPTINTEAVKVSPRLRKEYKVIHFTSSGLMRKKNQVFV